MSEWCPIIGEVMDEKISNCPRQSVFLENYSNRNTLLNSATGPMIQIIGSIFPIITLNLFLLSSLSPTDSP